jgi:hypothetical protein
VGNFEMITQRAEIIAQNMAESLQFLDDFQSSDPDEIMKAAMAADALRTSLEIHQTFADTFFMAIALLRLGGPNEQIEKFCHFIDENGSPEEIQALLTVLNGISFSIDVDEEDHDA